MAKKQKLRKGKYKVVNWSEYNKSLKERGDLTIWFSPEGIATWLESESNSKNRGRPCQYSDLAIKTPYIIRQVFNLRLRQTEGFINSILKMLEIELPVPDYTTISRRVRGLSVDITSRKLGRKINLIL